MPLVIFRPRSECQHLHANDSSSRYRTPPGPRTRPKHGSVHRRRKLALPHSVGVKKGAQYFDSSRGKQVILFRRIGENETTAIEVCEEYAMAKNASAAKAHVFLLLVVSQPRTFSSPGAATDALFQAVRNKDEQVPEQSSTHWKR